MTNNVKYMRRAISLAKRAYGKTSPNPLVGAVIVKDDKIIGEGYHKKTGSPHAEINAINSANCAIKGSTIYVTLEPCSTFGRTPPCTQAIIDKQIKKVVIGSLDPNPKHAGRGVNILEKAGIEVIVNIEQTKCKILNDAFFHWITTGKPLVLLKMAMTLDGKIATQSGNSQWITGKIARQRVQKLRCWSDAILVGGETAREDNPSLTVRIPSNWKKQPKRFILSKSLKKNKLQKLFPTGNTPKIIACSSKQDWNNFLLEIGKQNITSLLIEGGGEVAAAVIQAKIVNKIEFHIAPKILGGKNSRTVVGGINPLSLTEAYNLTNVEIKKLGDDISVSGDLI